MKLSPWCKAAKITLIERDIKVNDLAEAVGYTRNYVSQILNGQKYSVKAVRAISDYLDLPDSDGSTISYE